MGINDFTRGIINSIRGNKMGLATSDLGRLSRYEMYWNMYKGNHWEGMRELGKAEVTFNKCRSFVDKAVAKEFKGGFKIKMDTTVEPLILNSLNSVWEDMNSKEIISEMIGQFCGVLGLAWVKVEYIKVGDFDDPYGEYPNGKIKIKVYSPEFIFPERDVVDSNIINKLTFMFETTDDAGQKTVYKEVWTKDRVIYYMGDTVTKQEELKINVIPFFEVPNLIVGNTVEYKSDLEDLIPINVEYNLKASDISEIIDYHSSPVTVVYGALLEDMDKGVDKLWSGLPKDARVENLEMTSDLTASAKFLELLKAEMHEVGSIPEIAFGSGMHISNTSGVALETAFSPLTELIDRKRNSVKKALPEVNKFIIKLMIDSGMVSIPDGFDRKLVFKNEILFDSFLPKDTLTELNCIATEMKLGLEDREGASKRLGKTDTEKLLERIDADRAKHPDIYGTINKGKNLVKRDLGKNKEGDDVELNSGHFNSPEGK